MKFPKILFYITLSLLSALMIYSASMYFLNTETIQSYFENLGYSGAIVIPLAIAKILGLIAIWFIPNKPLKHLAFLGFFIDVVLALIAHLNAKDGGHMFAVIGLVLVISSYIFWTISSKADKQ